MRVDHRNSRRSLLTGLGSAAALSAARAWARAPADQADAAAPSSAAAGTLPIGDQVVNRLGFGAMRLTGAGIWGAPPHVAQARAVLRRAIELQVNFIDTSDAYGPDVSEQLIYEALHPYPRDLLIATKGGFTRPSAGEWRADGTPAHLRAACEASLRRLHLPRIDLYQFHTPDPAVPIEESIGELARLQQQGKIRHIGVSNFSLAQLKRAQAVASIVSVQNRYNLADRDSEDVLQYCAQQRLAFLPWQPLAGDAAQGSAAAHALTAQQEIARQRAVSPQRIALAWLLAHSPATLPIPGTSSPEHLQDNVCAASLRLTPAELRQLG